MIDLKRMLFHFVFIYVKLKHTSKFPCKMNNSQLMKKALKHPKNREKVYGNCIFKISFY